jgi:hypothetical protein
LRHQGISPTFDLQGEIPLRRFPEDWNEEITGSFFSDLPISKLHDT